MKPMLAGKLENIDKLKFPVLVSPKLDGVRAIVISGVLMSRSLKPIPNRYAQQIFSKLPDGTDGELIVGEPTDDPYRKTVSAVMSEDGENPQLRFYYFDNFNHRGGFRDRFENLSRGLYRSKSDKVVLVPHKLASCLEELNVAEESFIAQGYEGAMVRSLDGPYKYGRSTEKEGYLLKMKRFVDSEAVVESVYEQMHNDNEAETNELGRTERSSKKEGLVPAGILGGLNVRDVTTKVEFSIGTGFTLEERQVYWKNKKMLTGLIVKYKYFPTGSKDRPRHPVFLGWRSIVDMGE